jgi:hypothetical protein
MACAARPVAAAKSQSAENGELAKASGAKVLVVGMRMPPNFGPSYTAQFEAMYAEVAKAVGGGLVPFFLDRIGTDLSKFQADKIIHGCCAAGSSHRVASAGEAAEMSVAPITVTY